MPVLCGGTANLGVSHKEGKGQWKINKLSRNLSGASCRVSPHGILLSYFITHCAVVPLRQLKRPSTGVRYRQMMGEKEKVTSEACRRAHGNSHGSANSVSTSSLPREAYTHSAYAVSLLWFSDPCLERCPPSLRHLLFEFALDSQNYGVGK